MDIEIVVSPTRSLNHTEIRSISTWIMASGELSLISGNSTGVLSDEELNTWFISAERAAIAVHKNDIIGLATLTRNEANLPDNIIEVCHCIVKPEFRRLYNGTSLVHSLTAFAKQNGYQAVVGRVVTSNAAGISLLQSLRWDIDDNSYNNDNSITWLKKQFAL